jgi:hypothetical protein
MMDDKYIQLAEQSNEIVERNKRMADIATAMYRQIAIPDFSSLVAAIDLSLPAIDTSSLALAMDLSRDILQMVQPVVEWQDQLTRQIQDMVTVVDSMTQQTIANLVASTISFEETISLGIFDRLTELIEVHQNAEVAFKASGWPVAPSMPYELRERVVSMHKQGKTRYVSRTIMGYYERDNHRHLVEAVGSWENHPLFASRMHIIKDALEAHCDGRYSLSVPALIPQIEGILNEYVLANGLVVKFGKIQQVYNAVIGDADSYSLSTWVITSTLLFLLKHSTYAFTDFADELKKSVNSRKTTRHTILHGVALKYDRPIHSLKAFLILDAISALQDTR